MAQPGHRQWVADPGNVQLDPHPAALLGRPAIVGGSPTPAGSSDDSGALASSGPDYLDKRNLVRLLERAHLWGQIRPVHKPRRKV